MILGIAGSRSIEFSIPEELMPEKIDRIISGGAKGIDRSARDYALLHHIPFTEILPEYELYGRKAPLIRNDVIIKLSDMVYIFWDGKSRGSNYVINKCKETGKPFRIFVLKENTYIPLE
ncbi:MAG: hypothetical protein IJN68_02135 [Clostridia bacterium]|nr:hypothetical protein [Clostridia bacterium]